MATVYSGRVVAWRVWCVWTDLQAHDGDEREAQERRADGVVPAVRVAGADLLRAPLVRPAMQYGDPRADHGAGGSGKGCGQRTEEHAGGGREGDSREGVADEHERHRQQGEGEDVALGLLLGEGDDADGDRREVDRHAQPADERALVGEKHLQSHPVGNIAKALRMTVLWGLNIGRRRQT